MHVGLIELLLSQCLIINSIKLMNTTMEAAFKAHSPKEVKEGSILQKILKVFRLMQLV